MPPWIPRKPVSWPRARWCSRARASSSLTWVKTAMGGWAMRWGVEHEKAPRVWCAAGPVRGRGLELQRFPGAATVGAVLCGIPAGSARFDLIGGQCAGLGLHGDAFGFTAHAQLVDLAATVFVVDAFDALVVAIALGRRRCSAGRPSRLGRGRRGGGRLCHGQGADQQAGTKKGGKKGCAHGCIVEAGGGVGQAQSRPMSTSPTLLLVDGSSYLYRAYHAMPDLRAVPGDHSSPATGAIRGMVNMLQVLGKEPPTADAAYAVCVFDASGPTFRDAWYPQYKANRSPMPDDLRSQIEPIHEVVQLLGWKVLCVPGVEADDVIATLAQLAARQGVQVIVSSGDKDLSQLVNEHITIIDTMNGKRRDVAGVTAEFGVPPPKMIDYQALIGDTVDNVPGVTKVGPKTAAKWLEEYGTLDNLIANADAIKGVAGQNLRDAIASGQLALSRQLVTMKTDCDLSTHAPGLPDLAVLQKQELDALNLRHFYDKYGLKGLARALQAPKTEASPTLPAGQSGDLFDADDAASTEVAVAAQQREVLYTTILTEAQLQEWLAKIQAAELTAIDTETDSLDEMRAHIVGISLSVQVGEAAYIPLRHEGMDVPEQLPLDWVLAQLQPWLEDASKPKLGQHVKYDQHVFANHGITVRGYAHDTMLPSYVPALHRPHGLESLALRHTGRTGLSYEDLCGKGKNQIPFAQVPLDKACAYACEDADQTLEVHRVLWPQIEADARLRHIYELESATSEALFRMERDGVRIDAG